LKKMNGEAEFRGRERERGGIVREIERREREREIGGREIENDR